MGPWLGMPLMTWLPKLGEVSSYPYCCSLPNDLSFSGNRFPITGSNLAIRIVHRLPLIWFPTLGHVRALPTVLRPQIADWVTQISTLKTVKEQHCTPLLSHHWCNRIPFLVYLWHNLGVSTAQSPLQTLFRSLIYLPIFLCTDIQLSVYTSGGPLVIYH
jgi:hypothetical protein